MVTGLPRESLVSRWVEESGESEVGKGSPESEVGKSEDRFGLRGI